MGRNTGNDDFYRPDPIPAVGGSYVDDNSEATPQQGEQGHFYGVQPKHSLWWAWTAPDAGPWQIDTIGSGFDTVLVGQSLQMFL